MTTGPEDQSLPTPTTPRDEDEDAPAHFTLARQLTGEGHTNTEIARATQGHVRLRRGVYVSQLPESPIGRHLLRCRAVLATHSTDTVLSHVSAALAWGFPIMLADLGPVQTSTVGDHSSPYGDNGLRVHGSILSARDVSETRGLRVTSPVRTVVDCARSLPFRPALAVADAAAHAQLLDGAELHRVLSEMKGWKGIPKARRVLAEVDPAAESPGETWTRMVLQSLGFQVTSQFEVHDRGHMVGRADFRIVGTRVLVEFDGRHKYHLSDDGPAAALWQEKVRQDALVMAGYEVVRLTWADLRDPSLVRDLVQQAMRRGDRRNPACSAENDR